MHLIANLCLFRLAFTVLLWPALSLTQTYTFKSLTIEDGLAQTQVKCIYQDSKGYLWFGTLGGGVSRYDGASFYNFGPHDGLGSNIVYAIVEDKQSNLWFATEGGLTRFDGNNFVNFTIQEGLSHNSVRALFLDSRDTFWIGTEGGLNRVSQSMAKPSQPALISFVSFSTERGGIRNVVQSIFEDRQGSLWVGTKDGLCQIASEQKAEKKGQITKFTTADGLIHNDVRSILEDPHGYLWFATRGGLSKYNGVNFTNFTIEDGLANNITKWLYQDRDGYLWIGTWRGVSKSVQPLDLAQQDETEGSKDRTFTSLTTTDGLLHNIVTSILQDRESNIWLGSWGGISKYYRSCFTHYTVNEGLSDNGVWSILQDREGALWFGTDQGLSTFLLEPESMSRAPDRSSFHRFTADDGLADNIVKSMVQDSRGDIWAATWGGLSRLTVHDLHRGERKKITNFTVQDGLVDNVTWVVFRDSKDNLWIGTDGGVSRLTLNHSRQETHGQKEFTFSNLTTSEGLLHNWVRSICEDREGNIWIGTWGGLSKLDTSQRGESQELHLAKVANFTTRDGLNNNIILTILEDPARPGEMWLGTYGGGVARYISGRDGTFASFDTFTTADGLSDNAVVAMVFDNSGDLLIGTNKGINKLDIPEYHRSGKREFRQFGKEEGFTGIECVLNAVCNDKSGHLWFGTIKGVTRYDPEHEEVNRIEPLTHIRNLRLHFEDTGWSAYSDSMNLGLPVGLRLPHDQNHLIFEFIGISLTVPEKVRYRYMLEGFDDAWSPAAKDAYATYAYLPPGDYTFKVKASNNDGIWNTEATTFSFQVLPPVWQTWWFSLLCLAVTSTFFFVLYYRVKLKEQKRAALDRKIADLRLKALSAQMKPHFISNTINSIQYFISCNDQESAFDYLGKFSRLMRMTLENSEQSTITVARELQGLKLYLELESLRFEDKFTYTIAIDSSLHPEHFEIPVMLIQPYIENAIHHAFPGKSAKGKIHISLRMENNLLVCCVEDNGIGLQKSMQRGNGTHLNHSSKGMKITRERLELLNTAGETAKMVEVIDLTKQGDNGSGTLVKIHVPLKFISRDKRNQSSDS